MTKQDLISETHDILKSKKVVQNRTETKEIFDTVLDVIGSNIVKGKTLTITDFGTFSSNFREFKNPNDRSEKLNRFSIKFKPSTTLKKLINGKT